jgi:hypothetical protein
VTVATTEYHKIESPFKRFTEGPNRNKFDFSQWSRPEFELLQHLPWHWTEKVDGTNIRVVWDGHRVAFGGRTDAAQIPTSLLKVLDAMFPEELLEQVFGEQSAVLYGEGYGAKIQKMGAKYLADGQNFCLFDVKAGNWWLTPDSVTDVAMKLGLRRAPVMSDRMDVATDIDEVSRGLTSMWGDFWAEGLVGRPPLGITARDGSRLLMKVKHVDLYRGEK